LSFQVLGEFALAIDDGENEDKVLRRMNASTIITDTQKHRFLLALSAHRMSISTVAIGIGIGIEQGQGQGWPEHGPGQEQGLAQCAFTDFTESNGLVNRVSTKVDKMLGDETLNTINDAVGKVINSPLVEAGLIASGQPELIIPFELGKSAYNLGNTTFQTTKQSAKTVKDVVNVGELTETEQQGCGEEGEGERGGEGEGHNLAQGGEEEGEGGRGGEGDINNTQNRKTMKSSLENTTEDAVPMLKRKIQRLNVTLESHLEREDSNLKEIKMLKSTIDNMKRELTYVRNHDVEVEIGLLDQVTEEKAIIQALRQQHLKSDQEISRLQVSVEEGVIGPGGLLFLYLMVYLRVYLLYTNGILIHVECCIRQLCSSSIII